jgi:2-polyprenyl-3-methyl-5-hydroxy-6-metoxy-1,4-benzoquinol methylase
LTSRTPGPEAVFQLAALWAAKRLRGRVQHQTGKEGEFYSEFFTDEDEDAFGWDPRARQRAETVRETIARLAARGASVLDVGCGLGEVLDGLTQDYRCFGVDYAESNVRRASRRLGERARVQQGSAYALPFDAESMDAVICLEVLEHLADDRAPLTEMLRVLKPTGVLILAVPYTYYWPAYLELMGHYRHYTRESLTQLVREAGCDVVEYLPNYPRWHQHFTRGFVAIKAMYLVESRLGLTKASMQAFRLWPGALPAIEQLERQLSKVRDADGRLPYADLSTSTFVVARRRLGGA